MAAEENHKVTHSGAAMNTLDPLLHAVLANPEYDIVRLVYADALEEAGDGERAEFIRVQIALANQRNPERRPPASKENDRVQDRLEKRINDLWRGGIDLILHGEMCKLFDGSIATVIDPNWKPRDHDALSAAAIRWARFEAVRRGLVPDVWKETTPPPVAAAL